MNHEFTFAMNLLTGYCITILENLSKVVPYYTKFQTPWSDI